MQGVNRFKTSYELLLLNVKQTSRMTNLKLRYNKIKTLTPSLLININNHDINNHKLLLGGNLKFDFSENIQIDVEKKSSEQLVSTHLFYDDYELILNNIKRRGDIIKLRVSYQSKIISFDLFSK